MRRKSRIREEKRKGKGERKRERKGAEEFPLAVFRLL